MAPKKTLLSLYVRFDCEVVVKELFEGALGIEYPLKITTTKRPLLKN